ncbi:MAG: hypothetical protein ACOZAL_00625 [Patescibacteria group bacterium]
MSTFKIIGDGTYTSSVNIGGTIDLSVVPPYPGTDGIGIIEPNNEIFVGDSGIIQTFEKGQNLRRFPVTLTNLTTAQALDLMRFFRIVQYKHWFTLLPFKISLYIQLDQQYGAGSTTILQNTQLANQSDDYWIDFVAIITSGSAAGQKKKVVDSLMSPGQVICDAFSVAVALADTFYLGFPVRIVENSILTVNYKLGIWRECSFEMIEVPVK